MKHKQEDVVLAMGVVLAFAVTVLILSMAIIHMRNDLDAFQLIQNRVVELEQENAELRNRIAELEAAAEKQSYTIKRGGDDAFITPERIYAGSYYITGYDICVECCGKIDGITASGAAAQVGRTIASNAFPFGTTLYIDGIGTRIVEDCGNMPDYVIDVLCEDHPACYALTGWYDVYIISEGE